MGSRSPASSITGGRNERWAWIAVAVLMLASSTSPAWAQYNAGSSGIHGAFPPAPVPTGTRAVLWNLKSGVVRFCEAYDDVARPDTCGVEISSAQIPAVISGGPTNGVYHFTNFDLANSEFLVNPLPLFVVGHDGPTPLTILSQGAFRLY